MVLALCGRAVAQQAIGTNYSGAVSFGSVSTTTFNANTQNVGSLVVTNPDNTIWIMSSNGIGTNAALTSSTNYGSIGRTNWTWMDAAGWHNTNNSAAAQGVDISKGKVTTPNLATPTNTPTDAQVLTATGTAGDTKWATAAGGGTQGGTTSTPKVPYASGANTLANTEFTYTNTGGKVYLGTTATNAAIFLGGGTDVSGESAFLAARTLTGTGNAHCFADNQVFQRDGYAWNSFDIDGTICSASAFDHYAGIQLRPTFPAGSSFNNLYFIYGFPTVAGFCSNLYAFRFDTPSSSNVSNYYGLYLNGTCGTNLSYAIRQVNSASSNVFDGTIYGSVGVFSSTLTAGTGATVSSGNLVITPLSSGPAYVNSSHQLLTGSYGPGITFGATTILRATVTSKAAYTFVTTTDNATTFRNGGGACTWNLPASPTTGDYFDLVHEQAGTLIVSNNVASANFRLGTNAAANSITSANVGATARVLWTGNIWVTMFSTGDWTSP